jgi:hypothetical protein
MRAREGGRENAIEAKHLREAERHVADAKRLFSRLEQIVELRPIRGDAVEQATRLLAAMKEALATCVAHRDFIAQTLEDIDDGRLYYKWGMPSLRKAAAATEPSKPAHSWRDERMPAPQGRLRRELGSVRAAAPAGPSGMAGAPRS